MAKPEIRIKFEDRMTNSPSKPLSLVDDFERVLAHADGGALSVGQTLEVLSDRGPGMVMVLVTLPCMVPGVASTLQIPVGAAIALFGMQVAWQIPPWLPGFLSRRSLSNKTLGRLVGIATKWGRPIEKLLRPRLFFMVHPITHVMIGITLAILGIVLAVPWFVPFTNEIPAAVIAILLLGLLERDGVFIIVGEMLSLVIFAACGYVIYLLCRYGFEEGLHMIRHALHMQSTTLHSATRPS